MISDDMIHGSWKSLRSAQKRLGVQQSSPAFETARLHVMAAEDCRSPKSGGSYSQQASPLLRIHDIEDPSSETADSNTDLRNPARIEAQTSLVLRAVAEAVLEEASLWLETELPRAWIGVLTERANVIYAHNRRFRQKIRGKGTAGRDWRWSFTRHWLSGLIYHRRPELYGRLPSGYSVGHDLLRQENAATAKHQWDQRQRTPHPGLLPKSSLARRAV